MKYRIGYGFITAIILSIIVIGTALAGAAWDYGTVPGIPPLGEVNWTAWLDKNIASAGDPPSEIITEDNTNSDTGVDKGYQVFGGIRRWVMQVENFSHNSHGDGITILLGGLGALLATTLITTIAIVDPILIAITPEFDWIEIDRWFN